MIALGVDSGSRSTGYGVVESKGNRTICLGFGVIRNPSDAPHAERLRRIVEGLREVIRMHGPSLLALEDIFVGKNAQSAFKLGQVRGAVMVLAMEEGLVLREFSPTKVKASVTGHGRADKGQVQYMVKAILGLPTPPKPHDAADALALAICGIAHEGRPLT